MKDPGNFIKDNLKGLYSPDEINSITRLILEKGIGMPLAAGLTCKFNHFSDEQRRKIAEIVDRLKNFEPIQYVLGETDFWGLSFYVNSSVLIPRPETEELIQWVLENVGTEPVRILDIGTGSGCIAVTLAKKLPLAEVHAWDISEDALDVARKNAENNGTQVIFSQRNILQGQPADEIFDVIISNPPYVTESEKSEMAVNVLDFEPPLALFVPDGNPLIFYEKIADLAINSLKSGGKLFFEINREKGGDVMRLLQKKGFRNIELKKDISGNERMIQAGKG